MLTCSRHFKMLYNRYILKASFSFSCSVIFWSSFLGKIAPYWDHNAFNMVGRLCKLPGIPLREFATAPTCQTARKFIPQTLFFNPAPRTATGPIEPSFPLRLPFSFLPSLPPAFLPHGSYSPFYPYEWVYERLREICVGPLSFTHAVVQTQTGLWVKRELGAVSL